MVLTITVVGNGQTNNGPGHAVLSPNELAQLMSGQTVTGLLNPDGSITLNSNVMPGQQLAPMPTTIQNGASTMTNTTGYTQSRVHVDLPTSPNSITNVQSVPNDSNINAAISNMQSNSTATQKKTGQKRMSAKQKLAQQQLLQQQQQNQHQVQHLQPPETRHIMTTQPDHQINQQPQVVATVQLPNGQIGQLIAPPGGQFWSPNAINLQQLSMAVAAATGTMPQTMSLPQGPGVSMQQVDSPNMQQQDREQQQQQQPSMPNPASVHEGNHQPPPQHQHQGPQSLTNPNQQVLTSVQLPNSQPGQIMGRSGQSQLWSGGPISLSQLSALAQQGVVQLSPIQGIPSTGANGQRMVEMLPQSAIQGLINQNNQPMQTISMANNGQFVTEDPTDSGKWQIVQSNQVNGQQQTCIPVSSATNNISGTTDGSPIMQRTAGGTFNQYVNSSHSNVLGDTAQSTQPQRKLKRLACTCPNCRDGDNNRNSGDKKKQHICHFPDCNKVYGKTSHLRAHLRWHSGERPYVCNWSFCGKKFTRSDELQRHRRTHTGEKRFQCSECLKRFMRSDHLSKHLKTHLSSKKGGSNQVEDNGMPSIVTIPQDSIKIEQEDMIDELALNLLDESDKHIDNSSIRPIVNNSS